MSRLVLHNISVDRGRERVLRGVPDARERRQGKPLDHHLHAQVSDIPSRVAQDLIEQRPHRAAHRRNHTELGNQAPIDLDVARLVSDLSRREQLGIQPGHLLHRLRRTDHRPLLAMQEL